MGGVSAIAAMQQPVKLAYADDTSRVVPRGQAAQRMWRTLMQHRPAGRFLPLLTINPLPVSKKRARKFGCRHRYTRG